MAICIVDRFGRFAQGMEMTEWVRDFGEGLFDGGPTRELAIADDARDGHTESLLDLASPLYQVVLGGGQ